MQIQYVEENERVEQFEEAGAAMEKRQNVRPFLQSPDDSPALYLVATLVGIAHYKHTFFRAYFAHAHSNVQRPFRNQ